MSNRRIAVVASEILGATGVGGAGTADSLLAVALGRRGHQVELVLAPGRQLQDLSPQWQRRYEAADVTVRPVATTLRVRPSFLEPTHAVFAFLRDDPPDVVVSDDWRGLAYAALQARELGRAFADTAFVVNCHGPGRVLAAFARKVPDTVARFGEEVAERSCVELADAVVSPSAWLLDWMRDHHWPVPESARVIQNLWQSVALDEPPAQAPTDVPVRRLAFFGQLRHGKGVLLFIEALRLLERDVLDGLELLFLGRETPRWTADRIRHAIGAEIEARLGTLRFETALERSAALGELLHPGTVAVIPSLLDNSPYAVAECIEHGIPFLASGVGGVPELVAAEDRSRTLFEPTASSLASALHALLSTRETPRPARPARAPEGALESWLNLSEAVAPRARRSRPAPPHVTVVACGYESERRARRLAEQTRAVEVEVVRARSRREGIERASHDWVVFLDDDDVPEDDALEELVAGQAASGADAVTAAVRLIAEDGSLQLFLGDAGALGLTENHFGVLGLVRRSLAAAQPVLDGVTDADWLLYSQVALAGGRIVSIPEPLSQHLGRPGTVADVPGDGLAVLEAFEARPESRLHDLPQLAATLAASYARSVPEQSLDGGPAGSFARRAFRLLRTEGLSGFAYRVRRGRRT